MAGASSSNRLCLPVMEWPEADRLVWRAAITKGDLLEENGPAAHWAPITKKNVEKAYGYWLTWLSKTTDLHDDEDPTDRITEQRVGDYVDHLRRSVAPITTFIYVLDFLRFAKAVAPEKDWAWLYRIKNRLWALVKPVRDKASRIRPSAELYALGLEVMDEAEQSIHRGPRTRAQLYRDGLIIALLAARPLRIKNLAQIEIARHLVETETRYWLRFEAPETKNRRPIEVPIPEALTPYLDRYLLVHRPALLKGAVTDRLWISLLGNPLSQSSLAYCVNAQTKRAFGEAITPHLFRDCAATSIAIEDPDHVRMAATILGHSSLATTQRHYDQSRMLAAGRNYQTALSRMRQDLRQKLQRPYKLQPVEPAE